jgi:hypothetical protein
MAGYSGTPLDRKLGIKEKFRVALMEMPADVRKELKDALAACEEEKSALDFAMIFVTKQADLKKQFPELAKQLAPAGMLWVSWPKKSSGVASDLDENLVRDIGLKTGLVDVKVCAVSDIWSGLKFVIRVKDRSKEQQPLATKDAKKKRHS